MKKIAVFLFLAGLAGAGYLAAAPQVIEEIVAIVNDDVITLSQYRTTFEDRVQFLKTQNHPQDQYEKELKAMKDRLLEDMIIEQLLLQQAKAQNINVRDDLKNFLDRIKKENNLTSDDDLKRAVQSQGVIWEQWLKQREEDILKQRVIGSEVYQSIVVDDSEVVQYYKAHPKDFTVPTEYKLRAVYLNKEGTEPPVLEARKTEVSAKVKAGTAFEAVAAEFSDAPLKESKGDLGTLKKGEIDKVLEEAVDKLKTGEVSPWIEAKNGWYLIKVEERKESYLKSFADSREDILGALRDEKTQKKVTEYLNNLRARSYVKILKPNPIEF